MCISNVEEDAATSSHLNGEKKFIRKGLFANSPPILRSAGWTFCKEASMHCEVISLPKGNTPFFSHLPEESWSCTAKERNNAINSGRRLQFVHRRFGISFFSSWRRKIEHTLSVPSAWSRLQAKPESPWFFIESWKFQLLSKNTLIISYKGHC